VTIKCTACNDNKTFIDDETSKRNHQKTQHFNCSCGRTKSAVLTKFEPNRYGDIFAASIVGVVVGVGAATVTIGSGDTAAPVVAGIIHGVSGGARAGVKVGTKFKVPGDAVPGDAPISESMVLRNLEFD